MGGLEFFSNDGEIWYKAEDGRTDLLDETKVEVVSRFIERVRNDYPEAFGALSSIYQKSASNIPYFKFLIVRRFCKCNFGKLDNTMIDINCDKWCFEKVDCPLRGECKYESVICMPKFNSKLSSAEVRVMHLFYDGCCKDEIADRLCISPETVKNHVKSVYRKLGIHEKSEFIRYANDNNMFNQI